MTAWTDPMATIIAKLKTIVLTPNSLPSISYAVSVGNVDASLRGGPNGEITPQFTVIKQSAPTKALDSNGIVSNSEFNYQISCWNQTYGPTENSEQLNEKMVNAVRAVIKANRLEPSGTIDYMDVVNEIQRDEPDIKPILRRTIVFVRTVCRR